MTYPTLTVVRTSALLVLLRAVGGLTAVALLPTIRSEFGLSAFGVWSVALSLVSVSSVMTFGLHSVITVKLSQESHLGLRSASLLARASLWMGAIGLLLGGSAMLIPDSALRFFGVTPDLDTAFRIVLLSFAIWWTIQQITALWAIPAELQRRFLIARIAPAVLQAMQSIVVLTIATLTEDPGLAAATLALLQVPLLGVTIHSFRRLEPAPPRTRNSRSIPLVHRAALRRPGFAHGAQVQLAGVADIINFSLDRLIISSALGLSAVAFYEIPNRAAMLTQLIFAAPLAILFPVLARAAPHAHYPASVERYNRLLLSLLASAYCGLHLLAEWVMPLWAGSNAEGVESLTLFAILLPSYAIHTSTGVWSAAMRAQGRFAGPAVFAVTSASINLLSTVILVGPLGLIGISIGTTFGLSVPSLIYHWWARRQFAPRCPGTTGATAMPVVRAILAGAAPVVAGRMALEYWHMSHWVSAPIAILGVVLSLLMSQAMGLWTHQEIQSILGIRQQKAHT